MTGLRSIKSRATALPRSTRILLLISIATFLFLCFYSQQELEIIPIDIIEQHVVKDNNGLYRIPKGGSPSVHLVVATTSKEDYSWVKELKVPGMKVIPYVADNTSAPHHAKANKGHEAMMYHQYFYDFYDELPDIAILIHSQARSWHVEALLDQSMIFSLNQIDLREVQRRGFLNLRVTWGIGCSSGSINTTRVNEESGAIPEQREMQEAFRANFNIYEIPEILATPCCSQIAVTKDLIRNVPREQYMHHIDWLMNTKLADNISGRTWEHMWQWLFLGKAIDCPLQHKAYCRLYHICFGGREEYDEWIELMQGHAKLDEEIDKMNADDMEEKRNEEKLEKEVEEAKKGNGGELTKEKEEEFRERGWGKQKSETKRRAREKMRAWLEEEKRLNHEEARVRKEVAIVRGAIESNRIAEGINLYGEEDEAGVEDIIFPHKHTHTHTATAAAVVPVITGPI